MAIFCFDLHFLGTITSSDYFGIISILINDSVDLNIILFSEKKEKKIQNEKFLCNGKTTLTSSNPI